MAVIKDTSTDHGEVLGELLSSGVSLAASVTAIMRNRLCPRRLELQAYIYDKRGTPGITLTSLPSVTSNYNSAFLRLFDVERCTLPKSGS